MATDIPGAPDVQIDMKGPVDAAPFEKLPDEIIEE